jgi:hypothetical protein
MYKSGKWLLHLRNKYGYKATFQKKVFISNCGPYDHHDMYRIEAMRGYHDVTFDIQKIEIHLCQSKITPKLRFGINHPVCWTYRNGEYTMITKDDSIYSSPNEWSDKQCIFLFFLCLQELSTRIYHYDYYKNRGYKNNKGHYKAIIKTMFILQYIANEAKKRDIYY